MCLLRDITGQFKFNRYSFFLHVFFMLFQRTLQFPRPQKKENSIGYFRIECMEPSDTLLPLIVHHSTKHGPKTREYKIRFACPEGVCESFNV